MNIVHEKIIADIEAHWKQWAKDTNAKKYVVGISGGVDSTCVAALAVKFFGKKNVIGVTLPCDDQADIQDSYDIINLLGIKHIDIDIGDANSNFLMKLDANGIEPTEQCKTNMPARLRMTALFAVAQSLDAMVLNTCNRSESVCGYDTLFGDSCGCYAPIKNLTKSEVMAISKELGIPNRFAYKTPTDGLQPLTDEQKFGFTYAELDAYIRMGNVALEYGHCSEETVEKIRNMFAKNKFKLKMINIEGPSFNWLFDVFRAKT